MKPGRIQFRFQRPLEGFSLDVAADVPASGVTALFGRSGSGKTTLLRCIAGLEQIDQAYLSIDETLWQDQQSALNLPPHQRALGYVFQEGALFEHLRVSANLRYGLKRSAIKGDGNYREIIELLDLAPLLDRYPRQLSGGERQRVAIGRALLNDPRLLLLDEPLAALDRSRKREILPYLEQLHANTRIPIIYVSHDLNELAQIADHLLVIEAGRLIAEGPINQVLSRTDLLLSRDEDAGAVIDARIIAHDSEFHLSRLAFDGGELLVGWIDRPVGSEVRLRIHAKDVSLTLESSGPTSILNIFPARVTEMAEHGRGREIVKLMIGETAILARITRLSRDRLELVPGKQVFAQIKSVALSL